MRRLLLTTGCLALLALLLRPLLLGAAPSVVTLGFADGSTAELDPSSAAACALRAAADRFLGDDPVAQPPTYSRRPVRPIPD